MFLCTVITVVNTIRIVLIVIGESVDNPCEKKTAMEYGKKLIKKYWK